VGVIVVAAGSSQRMDGVDKIYAPVLGRPLLAWSLDTLEADPSVDTVVVAVHRQRLIDARALVRDSGWTKVAQVCRGGATRQDSVREALWRLGPCDWVALHDGARPCITAALLAQGIAAAQATGAAVPALAVSDTVKRAGDDLRVLATVDRTGLFLAQTPQVFRHATLWAAYQQPGEPASDDAALVERAGGTVQLFPGSPDNIKVTEPGDLERAERILAARRVTAQ
jgi:2-C-methyl-D-erythritol 4-phosphate cytidylyltransferase